MKEKLVRAVEVFRELGWDVAPTSDAAGLPLGTPEQQRVARAGLASGDWLRFGALDDGSEGWVSEVDVDRMMLTLFAIRVGVDVRRTIRLIREHHRRSDDEALHDVVVSRGVDFATRLLPGVTDPRDRLWEHSATTNAGLTLRLVHRLGLRVPDQVDYLRDWTTHAAVAIDPGRSGYYMPERPQVLGVDELAGRFAEHALAAIRAGVPATGPLPEVLTAGLRNGWWGREDAVAAVLAALDAAARPSDRKAWAQLLLGGIAMTGEEMVEHANLLVGVLSTGEAAMIEAFAPALVAGAGDEHLLDVLVLGLAAPTKKALRTVLAAAAALPEPGSGVVDGLAPQLVELAGGHDRTLARAAAAVIAAWRVGTPPDEPDEPDGAPAAVRSAGWWQATPPLWPGERFELGEVSVESLADALAARGAAQGNVGDPISERALALANALAHRDRGAARSVLRGIRDTEPIADLGQWARGTEIVGLRHVDEYGVVVARPPRVAQRLGEVPVLLSTPTWVDLRIDPADLVDRLEAHQRAGAEAIGSDLLLAATRSDPALFTEEIAARLAAVDVPVALSDGSGASAGESVGAGPLLADLLREPVPEPEIADENWYGPELTLPAAYRPFETQLRTVHHLQDAFPGWAGLDWRSIGTSEDSAQGRRMLQLARRTRPFGPGLAANMIGGQRNRHPRAVADQAEAITLAWRRGLLAPGVADVHLLDWESPPTALAALAEVCAELAAEGMTSVVWPFLADAVAASVAAPRVLPGTVEVLEQLEALLPEVCAAQTSGLAGPDATDLPAVRKLAERAGSSRAVTTARRLVEALEVSGAR